MLRSESKFSLLGKRWFNATSKLLLMGSARLNSDHTIALSNQLCEYKQGVACRWLQILWEYSTRYTMLVHSWQIA